MGLALVRQWPVWGLPTHVWIYLSAVVLAVPLVAVAGLVIGSADDTAGLTSIVRPSDLLTYALFLLGAVVSVESTRRQGEPAGAAAKDLLSAWWLPIAFLLPPMYALLAPLPIMLLFQIRVRRIQLHRRIFSAAAIGLAHAAASVVFHAVTDPLTASAVIAGEAAQPEGLWAEQASALVLTWTAMAMVCAVIAAVINAALVALAVKMTQPESSWSEMLWSRENVTLELVELCTGIIITLVCSLHPLLAALGLIPLIFLQRGLMHRQLSAAARIDSKTGLLNALTLEREANAEIGRAVRTKSPLAMMLVDIDHFKAINDAHGHLVGDKLLRAMASSMSAQLRDYDLLARFGGDEFALLLPQTDMDEALRTAHRLRRRLAELAVPSGSAGVHTTVSIGVAALSSAQQDVTDLLTAADLALYRAKARGRDRVEAAAPEAEAPAW